MPYLNCPNCHLHVYSAAAYATRDYCPRCDARLGPAGRLFVSPRPRRSTMPAQGSPGIAGAEPPPPPAAKQ
jgi:hypothetical protein